MFVELVRIARGLSRSVGLKYWVPLAAALFLAAVIPSPAVAQDGPQSSIRISFTTGQPTLTVGDIVHLMLEVTHPANHVVVVPRLDKEWGPFEVAWQTAAQTVSNGDGTETTSQRIEVTLFSPGTFETPDLPISVRGPDGGVEQVFPQPVRLTVVSVLSADDEELRDIRPPAYFYPSPWRQPATLAVTALAVVAALVSGSYFVHRRLRGRDEQPVSVAETRPPWEIAVEEIGRLERLNLPGEGRFKDHYALVAGVTRAYVRSMYLEGASQADASEMTTDELATAIWGSTLDRKNARLVIDLLHECDVVRFSNYMPLESEAHEALRKAREFLDDTRPAAGEAGQQKATA